MVDGKLKGKDSNQQKKRKLMFDVLASDIIIEILKHLSKNTIMNFLLCVLSWDMGDNNWRIADDIRSFLFRLVYVLPPGKEYNPDLSTDSSDDWLVLTDTQYHNLVLHGFEWPMGLTLIEGTTRKSWKRYHKANPNYMSVEITAIPRTSPNYYEGHSSQAGIPSNYTATNILGLKGPRVFDHLKQFPNCHLERLVIEDYIEKPKYPMDIRVDSLQLNGRHPGIHKIVDLGSVKQLSIMTLGAYHDDGILKYRLQLTRLTDLSVLAGVGIRNYEFDMICGLPKSVRHLVVVVDHVYEEFFHDALTIAGFYPKLEHLELTCRVDSITWPRVRTCVAKLSHFEWIEVARHKLTNLKTMVWTEQGARNYTWLTNVLVNDDNTLNDDGNSSDDVEYGGYWASEEDLSDDINDNLSSDDKDDDDEKELGWALFDQALTHWITTGF